jgi:23S rRNA (cytosine1962-C5)-methyltransferase
MMEEGKFIMFRNRLVKVFKHLHKQAKRQGISCYRVYDHDLPEFPFCIEFYDDKLYVAEYKRKFEMAESAHDMWLEKSLDIISDVLTVLPENIFIKLRKRKEGRLGQYQKLSSGVQPSAAQITKEFLLNENEFIVNENGLQFILNMNDYLDTGLFLDHRITRQMVKEQSTGKKVLNLFAYTGSFSVYAAAGGAVEVVTVDLSNTYLTWAERNMQLNGFAVNKTSGAGGFKFVRADVKQYLTDLPENYFDIIIMDPPTFSNSKRMEDFLDIQKDHAVLINQCLATLKPGGVLYFSTNYSKFELDNENIKAVLVKDITKKTTPFDFEGKLGRYCFKIMK